MTMFRFLMAKQPSTGAQIFIFGGETGSTISISTVEIYKISSNSLSFGNALSVAVTAMGSAGDSVYSLNTCGSPNNINNIANCYKYTYATGSESSASSATNARRGHQAFCNGSFVFAAGGYSTSTNTSMNSVEKYTMSTNAWSAAANLNNYRFVPTSFGTSSLMYIAGGINFSTTWLSTVDKYTISTNSQSAGQSLGTPSGGHGRGSNTSKGVMVGGQSAGGNLATSDEYLISSDTVSSGGSLASARRNIGGGSDATIAYMPGGYVSTYVATCDTYNMSTSSRSSATSFSTPKQVNAGVASSQPGHL